MVSRIQSPVRSLGELHSGDGPRPLLASGILTRRTGLRKRSYFPFFKSAECRVVLIAARFLSADRCKAFSQKDTLACKRPVLLPFFVRCLSKSDKKCGNNILLVITSVSNGFFF